MFENHFLCILIHLSIQKKKKTLKRGRVTVTIDKWQLGTCFHVWQGRGPKNSATLPRQQSKQISFIIVWEGWEGGGGTLIVLR